MPQFQNFTSEDKIVETQKVTKGFFTGDVGTATAFQTASLSASQKEYYLNMQLNGGTADEFSVSYGSYHGSASSDTPDGQTKAVYWSMANLLLFPTELESQGFSFRTSASTKVSAGDVFFITAERARMKDRLNRKNWTLQLSGSGPHPTSASLLHLTDDSDSVVATPTPVGPRYNVVSGTLGNVVVSAATRTYGHFYPNLGIIALDGHALSHSIGGAHVDSGSTLVKTTVTGNGFGKGYATAKNTEHYKLATAIMKGAGFTLRNEEDKLSTQYFVRAKAAHWNFSVNPTFSSGSIDATFRIDEMTGNPTTFPTTIGLYDGGNNMVAVGRLSGAKVKSFTDEIIAKVILDH